MAREFKRINVLLDPKVYDRFTDLVPYRERSDVVMALIKEWCDANATEILNDRVARANKQLGEQG